MGFVKALSPAVLAIARRNKTAGKLAYNALAGATKAGKAAPKALPIIGAGLTAGAAYAGYTDATNRGEDPGKAAFKGIGGVLGSVAGGVGGGLVAGPLGMVAGHIGGDVAGTKAAESVYDAVMGGRQIPSVPQAMTAQEQRAYREMLRRQGRLPEQRINGGYTDIAGFKYTRDADPALVGMRIQQQAQNINAVQGYSVAKHLSNNQLRGVLGQQSVDRFGLGQMGQTERLRIMQDNLTQRYGIGQSAGVENRRTSRDLQLGLGEQSVRRYLGGKELDNQRYSMSANYQLGLGEQAVRKYLGGRELDNQRYGMSSQYQLGLGEQSLRQLDLTKGYELKERERQDKRYASELDANVRRQQAANAYQLGMFGAIAGLYR